MTLSPQEQKVVALIAEGHKYEEIAVLLGLKYESVKTYAKRIRAKLGLTSKVQIAIWALGQKKHKKGARHVDAA